MMVLFLFLLFLQYESYKDIFSGLFAINLRTLFGGADEMESDLSDIHQPV